MTVFFPLPTTRFPKSVLWLLLILPVILLFLTPHPGTAQVPVNVLHLSSYHPGYRWNDEIFRGIRETLNRSDHEVQLFVEYMDSKRISNPAVSSRLAELFREKYADIELDVVIVADDNAFSFFTAHRDSLFADIPAIFCGANDLQQSRLAGIEQISGINEAADIQETVSSALTLFPDTRQIIVISDQTTTGMNVSREIRRQTAVFAERVSFVYWDNLTASELRSQLAALKRGSIVLYAFWFRDRDGTFFEYDKSARMVASSSPVPVFALWEFSLGYGVLGGKVVSGYEQGRVAGEMALQVLEGAEMSTIPLVMQSPNRFVFDYNVLKRFGIGENSLPEESLVINRSLSVYERYTGIIWSILLAFTALSILTVFLLISIARQRRTETTLRKSQRFIVGITDNAPGVVFQLQIGKDNIYTLAFSSEKMGDIFGIDPSSQQLFDEFANHVHEDDVSTFWRTLNNAVRHKRSWSYEGRFRHGDGRLIWFTVQAAPRIEEDKTVFDGVLIDSTSSKVTEEKLHQSEQRLLEIINFLPDPTFVIDPQGRVLIWNKAMEDLTGVAAEEIIGKGNYEYALPFYGERRPVMIDLVDRWESEIARKYRNITKVGNLLISESIEPNRLLDGRYFRNVAGPLYDQQGNITGAIETVHDITKRRMAEAEAEKHFNETQKNLSFIQALMAAIPIPVYFKDTSFRFIDCNHAYSDLQGFDDITGKTVYDLYPKELADFYWQKDEELLHGAQSQHFESTVVDKDKQIREVLFAKQVFRDHTGNVAGIVGAFMDISDFKETVREKERLESQLRQSQKMEALGTLAGGVAHDFNNILSAVLGYSELGMQDRSAQEGGLHAKFKAIHSAGQRAKELVDQILAFSRMQEKVQAPVNMTHIVREVVKLLKSSLPADIEIAVLLSSKRTVLGDGTQLHQVIMNLCTNAYHAMLESGGRLTIRLDDVDIEETVPPPGLHLPPGPYICLTVSDTGSGIPHAILPKIFDPYFTTKKKGKGTGLGLAVVHGIVKRHQGDITVTSQPGAGSEFCVYLPACEEMLAAQEEPLNDLPHGKEHLLLIDDEHELVQVGTEMLTHLGYKVTGMTSSKEAVRLFAGTPRDFDLVISDFDMPELNGGMVAREILAIRKDIPVIIYTGYTERLDEERAKEIGIARVLMKPLSLGTISREVRTLLDGNASGDHEA